MFGIRMAVVFLVFSILGVSNTAWSQSSSYNNADKLYALNPKALADIQKALGAEGRTRVKSDRYFYFEGEYRGTKYFAIPHNCTSSGTSKTDSVCKGLRYVSIYRGSDADFEFLNNFNKSYYLAKASASNGKIVLSVDMYLSGVNKDAIKFYFDNFIAYDSIFKDHFSDFLAGKELKLDQVLAAPNTP